jgi:hypothetical protein
MTNMFDHAAKPIFIYGIMYICRYLLMLTSKISERLIVDR